MRRALLLIVGFVLALSAGCRRDTAPEAKFVDVMDGPGGRKMVPINIPQRKAEAVLGPIAAAEQPANAGKEKGESSESSKEGVTMDTSSAEAAGKTLAELASAEDWKQLPEILVTDQADSVKEIIDAVGPFLTSVGQMHKAAAEKFSGHAILIKVPDAWLQNLMDMADQLTFSEVQPVNDEEAKVILTAGPTDGGHKIELTAKKADDKWKLSLPDFQAPSDAQTVANELEGKTKNFEDLAKRIESGDVAEASAVDEQVEKIMSGSYEPSKAADGEQAEPKPEPKPETAGPKPERSKSELEQQVDMPQRHIGL